MDLKALMKLAQQFEGKSGLAHKLGQSHLKGDPLDFETAREELGNPYQEAEEFPDVIRPSKPTPAAPAKSVAPAAPKTSLPADVKAKLDVGAPGLKGVIFVSFPYPDPTAVSVRYNTELWNKGASAMKRVLTNALTGYNIGEVVGEMNPNWAPNYL